MGITIDLVREMAEEIAPKVSSVMELPVRLDNLEFIFKDDTSKFACYHYQSEENKGRISIPIKYGRNKHELSYIIAHELCHHIQFSNFPHLKKERGIIKEHHQILPYKLLIEGDADFSAWKAGYLEWRKKVMFKIDNVFLAFLRNGKYDTDLREDIDIYSRGYAIVSLIYQKDGRKEVNRLYSLSLEDRIEYFKQFDIAEMVSPWARKCAYLLERCADKFWKIEYDTKKCSKELSKELSKRYWCYKLRAMPEYREFIEALEQFDKLVGKTKDISKK